MLALVFSVTTTSYLNAQNQKAPQTVQYDFLKGLTKLMMMICPINKSCWMAKVFMCIQQMGKDFGVWK